MSASGPASTLESFRVLAIDDDERVTRLVHDHLAMRGWDCVTAPDGPRGFALAADGRFDLVLLDLGLPGMDGHQVLRELRRLVPGTPVVVMTGSGTAENAISALRHGATDFITKPFHLKALDDALDRSLTSPGARTESFTGAPAPRAPEGAAPETPALQRSLSTLLTLLETAEIAHEANGTAPQSVSPHLVALVDALARSLALPGREARLLRWAARLTTTSDDVLRSLQNLGEAARIARLRAERWDGAGPAALGAEAIPLPARCLAVAEAAAHTATVGAPADEIRTTLQTGSGTRWDAALVQLCSALPADLLVGKPDAVARTRSTFGGSSGTISQT